jgi:tRNA (guanine37-N1)-methyltransferase
MRIDVITLFPEIFEMAASFGPIRRAVENEALDLHLHDLRTFADGPREVDDYPFGGGSGMILKPEPIVRCLDRMPGRPYRILLSPQGKVLRQPRVEELSGRDHMALLCGRYKGIDERVRGYMDLELSVGDYVLSGGELPGLTLLDAVSRLLPGALGDADSAATDSFASDLLDAPYYTKPRSFEGQDVPDVLLSGNHEEIRKWRRRESLRRTYLRRPDLLGTANLSDEDVSFLERIKREASDGERN